MKNLKAWPNVKTEPVSAKPEAWRHIPPFHSRQLKYLKKEKKTAIARFLAPRAKDKP